MNDNIHWQGAPILTAYFDDASYEETDEYDPNPQRAVLSLSVGYRHRTKQTSAHATLTGVQYFPVRNDETGEVIPDLWDFGDAMQELCEILHKDITKNTGKRIHKNWIGTKTLRSYQHLPRKAFANCDLI